MTLDRPTRTENRKENFTCSRMREKSKARLMKKRSRPTRTYNEERHEGRGLQKTREIFSLAVPSQRDQTDEVEKCRNSGLSSSYREEEITDRRGEKMGIHLSLFLSFMRSRDRKTNLLTTSRACEGSLLLPISSNLQTKTRKAFSILVKTKVASI